MTHYMVVESLYKNEEDDLDRWVEHHDCPVAEHWDDPKVTCPVGKWFTYYGFSDLADDPQYWIPGKHEIDFYSYVPENDNENPDAYLYFVNND